MPKRNAQGAGTIRKKTVTKNGQQYTYWEARITTGRDPGTGRQIQRSFTGKTQKEVREKLQSAAVEINNSDYIEPSKMTLSDWLDIWLSEYQGDKKYLTVKNYRAQVETHIKPALGAVKLSQLTPHAIQRFYNDLLSHGTKAPKRDSSGKIEKKNGKTVYEAAPMSPKSVRNTHGVLTKALSVAVNIGYLRSNPADKVTLPRVEKTELKPLNDAMVKAFLVAAEGDEFEPLFKTIIFTGLRESEALGLTWDNINFDKNGITVCKQLQKRSLKDGGATFAPLKNDKTRVLTAPPFVMEILKAQKAAQIEARFAAGELWQGWQTSKQRESALVFSNPLGLPLTHTTMRNHFKKIVTAIGAPECRVHDLRHTYAVLSLQNGDDIKTVQGNLGHATAAFTLDVYGHVSERMKDESAARMQQYIQNIAAK